jgi:hypothetical protein
MDFKRNFFCSALALAISGSVFAQGFFDNKLGGANSPVSGSASADGAKNAALALEKCEKPFGTIAVVQPHFHFSAALQRFSLPSTNLLRLYSTIKLLPSR